MTSLAGWVPRSATLYVKPSTAYSKYHAKKCYSTVLDRVFDSIGEAQRAEELHLMQSQGIISNLEFQVVYQLTTPNGKVFGKFTPDFRYTENGETVVEDYKGKKLPDYVWRKRWLKLEKGIVIRESGG